MSHVAHASLAYTSECMEISDEAVCSTNRLEGYCKQAMANSSKLDDKDVKAMADALIRECETHKKEMEEFKSSIKGHAVRMELTRHARMLASKGNQLEYRLKALNEAINASLSRAVADDSMHKGLDEYLEKIDDKKLKLMLRMMAQDTKYETLSLDELKELAQCKIDPNKKVSKKLASEVVKDVKGRMVEAKASKESIDAVSKIDSPISPTEMMDMATKEIVDERLRKKAVNAIVKAITARGFIVKKENIRLLRDENIVVITSSKPGGQRAEFKISLDGKFVYKFDEYEGNACEKDIEPFEKDLENIYGIKLNNKEYVWSNPDKLAKTHYTEMKTKRQG